MRIWESSGCSNAHAIPKIFKEARCMRALTSAVTSSTICIARLATDQPEISSVRQISKYVHLPHDTQTRSIAIVFMPVVSIRCGEETCP